MDIYCRHKTIFYKIHCTVYFTTGKGLLSFSTFDLSLMIFLFLFLSQTQTRRGTEKKQRGKSRNGNNIKTKVNESFDNGVFFDIEAKPTPSIITCRHLQKQHITLYCRHVSTLSYPLCSVCLKQHIDSDYWYYMFQEVKFQVNWAEI